jgi:hypothetical protein
MQTKSRPLKLSPPAFGSLAGGSIWLNETSFPFTFDSPAPYRAEPLFCTVTGDGDDGTLSIGTRPFGAASPAPPTGIARVVALIDGHRACGDVGPIAYDGSRLFARVMIDADGTGSIGVDARRPHEVDPVDPSPGFSGITTIVVKDAAGNQLFFPVTVPLDHTVADSGLSIEWYGEVGSSPGGPVGIITIGDGP